MPIRPSVNRPIVRRPRPENLDSPQSPKSTRLFVAVARTDELHRVNIAPDCVTMRQLGLNLKQDAAALSFETTVLVID